MSGFRHLLNFSYPPSLRSFVKRTPFPPHSVGTGMAQLGDTGYFWPGDRTISISIKTSWCAGQADHTNRMTGSLMTRQTCSLSCRWGLPTYEKPIFRLVSDSIVKGVACDVLDIHPAVNKALNRVLFFKKVKTSTPFQYFGEKQLIISFIVI